MKISFTSESPSDTNAPTEDQLVSRTKGSCVLMVGTSLSASTKNFKNLVVLSADCCDIVLNMQVVSTSGGLRDKGRR